MAPSVRQDLIAFLRPLLPEFNWYDFPPDNLKTPAVVVNPSDPYIVPFTAGGPDSVVWAFELVAVVGRGKPEYGLARLEAMWQDIQGALQGYADSRWLQFGEIGTTDISSVEHLTGTLTIAIIDKAEG